MADGSGLPADLAAALEGFERSLSQVESTLQPFLNTELDQLLESSSAVDRAKMEVMAAYTLTSLFYMYLRLQGASPNDHPVKDEIARLALYISKMRTHELLVERRLKVNKDASKTLVKSALFDVEEHQKRRDQDLTGQASGAASAASQVASLEKRKQPNGIEPKKAVASAGNSTNAKRLKQLEDSSDESASEEDDEHVRQKPSAAAGKKAAAMKSSSTKLDDSDTDSEDEDAVSLKKGAGQRAFSTPSGHAKSTKSSSTQVGQTGTPRKSAVQTTAREARSPPISVGGTPGGNSTKAEKRRAKKQRKSIG